jgi:hypothetical protein
MNKERMLLLADLLDNLKPVQFNMSEWFSYVHVEDDEINSRNEKMLDSSYDPTWEEQGELCFTQKSVQVMNGYDCKAAACIAGWAVVMKNDFALNRPGEEVIQGNWKNDLSHIPVLVEASEYLDLTTDEAKYLFTSQGDDDDFWRRYQYDLGYTGEWEIQLEQVTPKMAATAIRNVVAGEWELVP